MNIYERFGRTRLGTWWFLNLTLPRRYVWLQSQGLRLHPVKLWRLLRALERDGALQQDEPPLWWERLLG